MGVTLVLHVVAGSLGIVSGAVALSASKGGGLHRRSGIVFVSAMLPMALTGAVIAALGAGEASVIAGLLTAYLVTTALTTVRPPFPGSRGVDAVLMVLALALGLVSLALGFHALSTPTRALDGIPFVIFFKFATVALLAGLGDLRVRRTGLLEGGRRLARHLWRMCFALYVASASFFLGQADELPEALRVTPLLALLAFGPLLAMAYWLWRVRPRRSARGGRRVSPEPRSAAPPAA
jgi:hypothetical protein